MISVVVGLLRQKKTRFIVAVREQLSFFIHDYVKEVCINYYNIGMQFHSICSFYRHLPVFYQKSKSQLVDQHKGSSIQIAVCVIIECFVHIYL